MTIQDLTKAIHPVHFSIVGERNEILSMLSFYIPENESIENLNKLFSQEGIGEQIDLLDEIFEIVITEKWRFNEKELEDLLYDLINHPPSLY